MSAARWPQKYSVLSIDDERAAHALRQSHRKDRRPQLRQTFTYGGYHFAILETNEINAFAAPAGRSSSRAA
jgi:predicted Zn-dependent protease